jgi:uncharacterized protein YbaR (Trm112 family)
MEQCHPFIHLLICPQTLQTAQKINSLASEMSPVIFVSRETNLEGHLACRKLYKAFTKI